MNFNSTIEGRGALPLQDSIPFVGLASSRSFVLPADMNRDGKLDAETGAQLRL
jgi:hypothetical protein